MCEVKISRPHQPKFIPVQGNHDVTPSQGSCRIEELDPVSNLINREVISRQKTDVFIPAIYTVREEEANLEQVEDREKKRIETKTDTITNS